MREIGTIDDQRDAELFHAYLAASKIDSRLDRDGNAHQVWVYDYDQADQARKELERFLSADDRSSYQNTVEEYHSRRLQEQSERIRQQTRKPKYVENSVPFLHQIPVTIVIAGLCIAIFAAGLAGYESKLERTFSISAMPTATTAIDSPVPFISYGRLVEVSRGEIWRLITPILLHLHLAHIFFNLIWLVQLGGAIEYRRGWKAFLAIVITVAVLSNVAQFVYGGPRFVGISGVDAGLFGYLLIFSKYAPEEGLGIDSQTVAVMFLFLGLCLTPLIQDTANASHLVGLASGAGIAALTIGLRRVRESMPTRE